MSQFEYLSIAASIVLALAMGRLISSIPYVYSPSKIDPPHAALFFWMIFGCLFQWWNLWPLNSITEWNFTAYLILMSSPISFYLAAKMIVSDSPSDIDSWEEYFKLNYRWFFIAVFTAWLASRIRQFYFFDQFPSILAITFGASMLVGAMIYNKIVHGCIAGIMIAFLTWAVITGGG